MAKEKETSPVSHKLRTIFGIVVCVLGLTTLAGVGVMAFAAVPSAIVVNSCFSVAAITVAGGTAWATNTIVTDHKLKRNRKKSRKLLKEISEIDMGKKNVSAKRKAKIVEKYAKLQLKLCQVSKTPLNGVFHSVSHMRSHKGTQAMNELDARTILEKTSNSGANSKKISKLKNLVASERSRTAPCKWTKTYENVVKDVPIYDRRTEISCMNDVSVTRFKSLTNNLEPTAELGTNIIVTFKDENKYPSTYARVADSSKSNIATEILLSDVKKTCEGMSKAEVDRVFPILIEIRKLDKNTSVIKEETQQISNLYELEQAINTLNPYSSKTK